ncbi:sigma 54-interacting transcriptional regulator [Niallia sp. Man26]|uniref:sigma 54-interacting transcriptional regulator n=1 Tax=Niallia sp. Man26 TaxID=2912824 RepID=UPI001EDB54DB|nr:sigma 54-interacting transcriptional regulator [Niallia sp. Man26]UPO90124.1 sigma 54-interacting transcriptional regulator [Niallia sp. Man26]
MSKSKILKALILHTEELNAIDPVEILTAEGISEYVGIQRNTASQYLNELVKEKRALKVKSRPAYFFDREIFSQKFFTPKKDIYDNFQLLIDEQYINKMEAAPDPFNSFIGANNSLKPAIDQIKSSIYYPGTGLPFMLYGDTGVGKSLLAKMTFEYCQQKGLVDSDAPFLELNCAQYYHNQELLSSILFGYSKGAFTGANENHVGLLEAADGGILFLDECHRLGPESQEKLFTFIDKGTFQRIGENNKERSSKVRLIFATTENIKENFLRTFLRRIPITINIPNLDQRTKQELSEFIYTFLIKESKKLNKKLVVTSWIMNRLLSLSYEDNVGELKNMIKLICASAYSRNPNKEVIVLNSDALDNKLLSKFLSIKEIDTVENKEITILPTSLVHDFINQTSNETRLIRNIFKIYDRLFEEFERGKLNKDFLIQQLAREANTIIEILVNNEQKEQNSSFYFLKNTIKELVGFLESNHFVKISGNSIIALSNYMYRRSHFAMEFPLIDKNLVHKLYQFTVKQFLVETKLLNALLELIETKLDVTLEEEEKVLLVLYLKSLNLEIKQPDMHGVILAHGFSTASSIADVVNRFLDFHVFDAFDMPFNVSIDKTREYMERYLSTHDCSKGLVVLVDMGSLTVLSKTLVEYTNGPILMINNVTTQQALIVGEMLRKEMDIEVIGEKVTTGLPMSYEIAYPVMDKNPLIITVCHTGLGAAQQLKTFIQSSLPKEINFKVEAVDYNYIKKYGKDNSLFKQYDVQAIIGTANPEVQGIKFIALEDLISGQGEAQINEIFSVIEDGEVRKSINDALVRNLSIERLVSAITILDVKRVISYIDNVMDDLERRLLVRLSNSKKAILYVHIAGLVERSIRNSGGLEYRSKNKNENSETQIKIISQALEPIELAYNIKISLDELNYLYDIVLDE